MSRKMLEWQLIVILFIAIIYSAHYVYQSVFTGPKPAAIGTNSAGTLNKVTKIIVAEQTRSYARFIDTEARGALKPVTDIGPGKGKLYVQWLSRNSYGISIDENHPIVWRRTAAPGQIEITAPALSLLGANAGIDPDSYKLMDIRTSRFIDDEKEKN